MSKKRRGNFRSKVAADSQRQKAQGFAYGYLNLPQGVNMFNAEPGGRMEFDILPYEVTNPNHPDKNEEYGIAMKGDLWYKLPFKIHRNIGAENDSVVCPAFFNRPCPICEYRSKRMKEGADKEETDALKQSLRNLYVVVPLGDKEMEEVPHVWDISQFLFQNLLNDEIEEDEDYAGFPELEDGLTLKVRFDSKTFGKGRPYAETSRIDFIEREHQYTEKILKDVPKLDDMLTVLSYDELSAKFLGIDPVDVSDEGVEEVEDYEEDEAPTRKKKRIVKPPIEEEAEAEENGDCVACGGSGKNSRGGKCPICRGTGEAYEEEAEAEEDEPEKAKPEKPKAVRRKPAASKTKASAKKEEDDKCPHGHSFGKDCDEFDECNECEIWDECVDAQADY